VVWSGGGKVRKLRGEPVAVSHCVHGECHMTALHRDLWCGAVVER
jgi:hypothetical protein